MTHGTAQCSRINDVFVLAYSTKGWSDERSAKERKCWQQRSNQQCCSKAGVISARQSQMRQTIANHEHVRRVYTHISTIYAVVWNQNFVIASVHEVRIIRPTIFELLTFETDHFSFQVMDGKSCVLFLWTKALKTKLSTRLLTTSHEI